MSESVFTHTVLQLIFLPHVQEFHLFQVYPEENNLL